MVNDGSTDNSIDIAKQVFPNAVVIDQSNQGITKALNAGIPFCNGEYISRIDCGDIALPTMLEAQVSIFQKYSEVGVVGGHIILIEKNGQEFGICEYPIDSKYILNELLNGKSPIIHSGAMIRKSVLNEVNGYDSFFDGREDFELWCRILSGFATC